MVSARPCLLVLCSILVVSTATDLFLMTSFPFTGGVWDGGWSMKVGIDLILKGINANPRFLPGYNLTVVHTDSKCSGSKARASLLNAALNGKYTVFPSNKTFDELDVDHSGHITSQETDPLTEIVDGRASFGAPLGLLVGCSGEAMQTTDIAYQWRLPIMSGSTSSPALSDRSAYPNYFRLWMPNTPFCLAWLTLIRGLGLQSVVTVFGPNVDVYISMAAPMADAAAKLNMTLRGTQQKGFVGLRWQSLGDLPDVLKQLRRLNTRVVASLDYEVDTRNFVCAGFRSQLRGLIFLTFGWYSLGWWNQPSTSCTADQVFAGARSTILANAVYFRADSETELTCLPGTTMASFVEELTKRVGKGQMGEAATTVDAVCMLALMLHEVLINHSVPVSEAIAHSPQFYSLAQDYLSHADFEGVQGRIRFSPGKADVDGRVLLQQIQDEGRDGLLDIGTFNSDGLRLLGKGNLTFEYQGEHVFAGPEGSNVFTLQLSPFKICSEGKTLNFSTNRCDACPERTTWDPSSQDCVCIPGFFDSQGECRKCSTGTASAFPGASACKVCDAGTFSEEGAATCSYCPLGRYAGGRGSSGCFACPLLAEGLHTTEAIASQVPEACVCTLGAFSSNRGCSRCPANSTTTKINSSSVKDCFCEANFYAAADGGSCEPCPAGSSTTGPGKTSVQSCLCERGDYLPLEAERCTACPEGMVCARGSSEAKTRDKGASSESSPMQLAPGFWSSSSDPLQVFRCASEEVCPGGLSGTCSLDRDPEITACDGCMAGMGASDGKCLPCNSSRLGVAVVLGTLLVLIVAAVVFVVNRDLAVQTLSMTLLVVMIGIVLSGLQVFGLFSRMPITWVYPMDKVMQGIDRLNLNTQLLSPDCAFGPAPLSTFLFRQGILLAFMLVVAATTWVKTVAFRRGLGFRVEFTNAMGTIFLVLLIAIVASVTAPFVCYGHPGSSGFSMVASPSVLCFKSQPHSAMVTVSIIMIVLVVVPFLAVVVHATYRYRVHTSRGTSVGKHLRAFAFLFFRYTPRCYYYGSVTAVRGLLLSLIPTVARDSPSVQVILIGLVLAVSGYLQSYLLPWRAVEANAIDAATSIVLITMLICGALSTAPTGAATAVGIAAMILFVLFFAFTFAGIVLSIYKRLLSRPFFDFFLCHHKAGASAQVL